MLSINEFPTPTPGSVPEVIAAGPDGNLWFAELAANKIGQITPGGSITEFPILPVTSNARPTGITTGLDGNLWFTESNTNKIGRIRPDGTHLTEFALPSPGGPTQITTGPDGNLWFIENSTNKIGRLDPATGKITEYPAPGGGIVSSISGTSLAFGPDGNLWFTEGFSNMIGRITPDGSQIIELPIPTPGAYPAGITAGPDGYLWFTEFNGSQIARLNAFNFSVREFHIPTSASSPSQITTGLDGNLWFTEYGANKIGRITPDGKIDEFSIPTSNSGPYSITAGPDGNIWFTENAAHKIGQVVLTLPASHFVVSAAGSSTAGTPFAVTITAEDAVNRVVSGYTGTVHFTSSDSQATLPANYTFTAADNGVHTFTNGVTLLTTGNQTITVTDTISGITGSATITVTPSAPPVDHFSLSAPDSVVAGSSFAVIVTAFDAQGQLAKGYTGTVTFSSSDPYPGVLPSDHTFTSSDNGAHTFAGLSFFTAGAQTLTVQDTARGSVTGSVTIKVLASSANHFFMTAPATAVAGASFNVTVGALDPYGNLDTGYTGTVLLTSSDRAPHPSDYAFSPADNGMHTFVGVVLFTAGTQTVMARDAINSSNGGTATVSVGPAAANHFLVTAPSAAVSGMPFDVIVTALDAYGNTDTNYQGAVTFTTSDAGLGVVFPAGYTFTTGNGGDDGVHDFPAGVALITPGDQTLTSTDKASGITGSAIVTVTPGPIPPPGASGNGPWPAPVPIDSSPTSSILVGQEVAALDLVFTPVAAEEPPFIRFRFEKGRDIFEADQSNN